MDEKKTSEKEDPTKKSLETGEKVIEINKKIANQDGKDPEKGEVEDRDKWRSEG